MIVSDLHLSNVRSFGQKTIRFEPGLNLIIGGNSSGKKTILDALSFVLFGVGSPLDLSGFPGSPTAIEAGFLADGHAYRLMCTIDQGGSTQFRLHLPDNGRIIEVPPKSGRLRSVITGERTGPALDRLFSSVLCLRDDMLLKKLVDLSSFEKLFELNLNYDAVLYGGEVYKSLKQKMHEDRSRIQDSGAYRKKIEKLKRELRDKEMAIKEKVRVLQFLSEQYHKLNGEFNDLETKKNRIDTLEKELELNQRATAFYVAVRDKNIEPAELRYIEEYRTNFEKTVIWVNELEEMRIDRSILQKNLLGLKKEVAKLEAGEPVEETDNNRRQKLKIYRAQLTKTESELLKYAELDRQISEARAKKKYLDAANDRYAFLFDVQNVASNGMLEGPNLEDLDHEKNRLESELIPLRGGFSDERHGVLFQKRFEAAQRIEEEKFQLNGHESQKSSVLAALKKKTDQMIALDRLSGNVRSSQNSARYIRWLNDLLTFLPQTFSNEIKAALQNAFFEMFPAPGAFGNAFERHAASLRSSGSVFSRALFSGMSESERALFTLIFHLSLMRVFFPKPGLFFVGKRFLPCFDAENRKRVISFLSQAAESSLQIFVFSREPVVEAPGHLVQI